MRYSDASQSENWEKLGDLDPKYAIASRADKKFNSWTDEDFFKVGHEIISNRISAIKSMNKEIQWRNALDFGCGIGRLTTALASHFESVVGIDVSQSMIEKARIQTTKLNNINLYVEKSPYFDHGKFDFIIAHHVIQHIGSQTEMKDYIRTLCRHVTGVLVFNVPIFIPFKNKIQLKRRLFQLFSVIGFDPDKLYSYGFTPIRMNYLSRLDVRRIIQDEGLQVFLEEDVKYDNGQLSVIFYVEKPVKNKDVSL